MRELLRTNNPVFLSWIASWLGGEGITVHILDEHASVLEGSIGALPRRVVVGSADYARALRLVLLKRAIAPHLFDDTELADHDADDESGGGGA